MGGRFPESRDEKFYRGTLDHTRLFGASGPLEVELGTGKGRFLIESARAAPQSLFLGLERSLAYYRIARDRLRKTGLPNAAVLRAEARAFVRDSLLDGSVSAFHAYFLDPWPKKRQRKRRLLDAPFLGLLARKLVPAGLFWIKTDHGDYAEAICAALASVPALRPLPWNSVPPPPPTHYEIKYEKEGRRIWKVLLRRTS